MHHDVTEVLGMEKNLLKLLTVDREIRLFVVDVTKVLRFSALRAMRAEPARQLYVKIFANCALLRGLLTPEQRATVAVRFKPEGYSAHCEIDGRGAVHCLFSPKLCSFDGDVADLVGEGATLSITRGSWTGGMFTGTVELTQHAVDDFFSYFYSKSEQTETVFMTWTDAAPFRGCMVQPLPLAHREQVDQVLSRLRRDGPRLRTVAWEQISDTFAPWAEIVEQQAVHASCHCSREMFLGLLMAVDTEDLTRAIQENRTEKAECGVCGKVYVFQREDLEEVVRRKMAVS